MARSDQDSFVMNPDGSCAWAHELNMWKYNSIMRVVILIVALCALFFFGLFTWIGVRNGSSLEDMLKLYGLLALIMLGVAGVSAGCYAGVAAMYGGVYRSYFIMDNEAIAHMQPQDQADKAALIGRFAAAAGTIAHNRGTVMASQLVGSRVVVTYEYPKVRSITLNPKHDEIKMHAFLTWSSVYAPADHYDYVADYLIQRCKRAKVRRKQ